MSNQHWEDFKYGFFNPVAVFKGGIQDAIDNIKGRRNARKSEDAAAPVREPVRE